ncbi:MAG: hypothetical protein J3Q66DRAFT_407675 [Benniella sp.]|nr:MAG: hypothetical protein J3Q66DRAFT_407675 [Benniella sp.]
MASTNPLEIPNRTHGASYPKKRTLKLRLCLQNLARHISVSPMRAVQAGLSGLDEYDYPDVRRIVVDMINTKGPVPNITMDFTKLTPFLVDLKLPLENVHEAGESPNGSPRIQWRQKKWDPDKHQVPSRGTQNLITGTHIIHSPDSRVQAPGYRNSANRLWWIQSLHINGEHLNYMKVMVACYIKRKTLQAASVFPRAGTIYFFLTYGESRFRIRNSVITKRIAMDFTSLTRACRFRADECGYKSGILGTIIGTPSSQDLGSVENAVRDTCHTRLWKRIGGALNTKQCQGVHRTGPWVCQQLRELKICSIRPGDPSIDFQAPVDVDSTEALGNDIWRFPLAAQRIWMASRLDCGLEHLTTYSR